MWMETKETSTNRKTERKRKVMAMNRKKCTREDPKINKRKTKKTINVNYFACNFVSISFSVLPRDSDEIRFCPVDDLVLLWWPSMDCLPHMMSVNLSETILILRKWCSDGHIDDEHQHRHSIVRHYRSDSDNCGTAVIDLPVFGTHCWPLQVIRPFDSKFGSTLDGTGHCSWNWSRTVRTYRQINGRDSIRLRLVPVLMMTMWGIVPCRNYYPSHSRCNRRPYSLEEVDHNLNARHELWPLLDRSMLNIAYVRTQPSKFGHSVRRPHSSHCNNSECCAARTAVPDLLPLNWHFACPRIFHDRLKRHSCTVPLKVATLYCSMPTNYSKLVDCDANSNSNTIRSQRYSSFEFVSVNSNSNWVD